MIIPVAPVPLSPIILSFSIDSQCKKAAPEFFEGDTQGGGGQKWLQESAVTKFKIENTLGVDSYHSVDTQLPFSRHTVTIQ